MPIKSTLPSLGKKCGRRERESRREGRKEQSFREHHSFAGRDGRRHPGTLKGGALRGASSEGEPRSVRKASAASSAGGERTDDSGCPKVAEEGNVVRMRH